MWVVTGPFDDAPEDSPKKKVLYPGTTYPIGRGSDVLFLSSKTVSNEHGEIVVGKHPLSDAANADAIPTLTYTQKKKVATFVRPGEDHIVAQAGETTPVKSGDAIYITGRNLSITFTWVPVNILIRSGVSRDERNALTSSLSLLGIKSSFRVSNALITHVVFTIIPPPPYTDLKILIPVASGVHFVAPGWLTHVIKRGTMDPDLANGSLLAEYKDGLDEEKFRPDGAGLKAWTPDEKRKMLFKGVKFHFLTTTDTPADLLTLLTTASSLTSYTIPVSSDEADEEWDTKLESLKRKADKHIKKPSDLPPGLDSPFVLVGDAEALSKELGDSRWEGVYKTGMESLGIRMIWLPEIADALLKMDLSFIASAVADEQPASAPSLASAPAAEKEVEVEHPPLPAFIPSTHPSEPSMEPFVQNNSGDTAETGGTKKKLVRRVTGRPTPALEEDGIQEVGVRRSTRRSVSVAPPASAPPAPVAPEPPAVDGDDYSQLEEVPRTVLKRRVTRRAASKEPSIAPILPAPITHAVYASALGTYPEESSASIPDYDDDSLTAIVPPPPVRALKRRVTGRQKNGGTQSMDVDGDGYGAGSSQSMAVVEVEAPHKKYKALFEGTQQSSESVPEEGEADGSGGWGNAGGMKRKAAADAMDVDAGDTMTMTQRRKRIREGGAGHDSVGQSQGHASGSGSGSGGASGSALRSQIPASVEDETGVGSGPLSQGRPQPETRTTQTQRQQPTQAKPKATITKKVQLDVPSQHGEDSQQQTAAMTVDPQLQSLLQSKSRKTGATAGLDKEFTNLRLTAHPAERLKLEEEERLRKDLEVWKELQQKEKDAGGSMDGVGSGQRGNFMVVVLKDDLIVDKEQRRRSRGQAPAEADNNGAVPNFKKFRKRNFAALRGPKIELELPPPVDYGMGDAYWQNNHAGDATIGGDDSKNPLAGSYSQAKGGESSNGQRLNIPAAAQPRQKKQLQLPRVHSSEEDEPEVKPASTTKCGKAKGKAKPPQKKIDLHFSDLEDEDDDVPPPPKARSSTRNGGARGRAAIEAAPEDESEIFDLNVSGVDEEDDVGDDFGSTAGRTVKSSARSTQKSSNPISNSQSQRSTRASAAGGAANSKKRKAGGLDFIVEDDEEDELDDDDSDDGAFKGFGKKKKKTAAKKVKR